MRLAAQGHRIRHTEWLPIFGPDRERLVATQFSLFAVAEYTKIVDNPITGYERFHIDTWYDEEGRQMGIKTREWRGLGEDDNDQYCNRGSDVRWQDDSG